MQIKESFMVDAHPSLVWEFFEDVQAVSECMPGTQLTNETSPNVFDGFLAMKLGPIGAKFSGSASVKRDEGEMKGWINAKGVDRRGGSQAEAVVTYVMNPEASGTRVDIVAEIILAGQLGQFGRTGILQDISAKLTAEFASCLQKRLATTIVDGTPTSTDRPSPDIRAGRLFITALWARIRLLFRRRN